MTKQQYREARRLIRDNGRIALRWMDSRMAVVMDNLLFNIQDATDWLAERSSIIAYCNRHGFRCTVRDTRPLR